MPLKVIVIGAGIGGPAVAAALAQNGHSVTIYERAQSTTDVGFAFRITPNSDKCLKYLGIDTVAGGATQANTARQLDDQGNVIMEMGENQDAAQAKRGVSVFVSRPQVARELIEKAESLGVAIKTGVKVEKVDVNKTAIVLDDGSEVSADLVVAADGLYSVARASIVDTSKYKPRPTLGHNAFRFMIPRAEIQDDKELSKLFTDQFRMINWKGTEKRVLCYPVDFDKHYSIVCTHPAHLSDSAALQQENADSTAVAYNKKVSIETVHEIYSEFEARLHRLFDKADPDGFRIWKLQDLEELPQWSINRTVLIGDAAHAILPYAFSGASMTIEDAIVLGQLLPSGIRIEDVPDRLKLLEKVRKPRIQHVSEMSIVIGNGSENAGNMGHFMKWLGQYDAVEVGRQALKESGNE